MKKRTFIIVNILLILFGWTLLCFGYATKLGHPISTICFLGGLILFFGGIIRFITSL